MDRTNKYMHNVQNTSEYRDYVAEFIALFLRIVKNDAFRAVFATVTFISSFIFVIGIAGGIEMNLISYTVAIPVLVMMFCVLALAHKMSR